MKKVILIPDSFKGTMSSAEICEIMAERIRVYDPDARICSLPVADGGEGSVDAFLAALGGERVRAACTGPYGEPMEASYALLHGGKTAVIEMAACAGLPLAGARLHPEQTTTYGVGQLMADAARRGCKELILGLGGSCTNDFGAGAAAAAGIRFLDGNGEAFLPVGGTLSRVAGIDSRGLLPELRDVRITAMCDIDNPLCGPAGAAHVFAPQKGAGPELVEKLDWELKALAKTVSRQLGVEVAELPGAGAAGGMGAGMSAFFRAELKPGIETVLDTVGFDALAADASLVISGEGRIDAQSLRGKVVSGVARRCKRLGVPLLALVGEIGEGIEPLYAEGLSAVFSINPRPEPFSSAKSRSRENLSLTMDSLMRLIRVLTQASAAGPRELPEQEETRPRGQCAGAQDCPAGFSCEKHKKRV